MNAQRIERLGQTPLMAEGNGTQIPNHSAVTGSDAAVRGLGDSKSSPALTKGFPNFSPSRTVRRGDEVSQIVNAGTMSSFRERHLAVTNFESDRIHT